MAQVYKCPTLMDYLLVKQLHVICAVVSISFFALRGAWALAGSTLLQKRIMRVLPHVIDTVLLASALVLVVMSAQYPFVENWLTVKVFALLLYIVLGTVAIRRAQNQKQRVLAYLGALATACFMVSVAFSRSPWGFLAGVMPL